MCIHKKESEQHVKHGSKSENDYITFLHMFNILIKC